MSREIRLYLNIYTQKKNNWTLADSLNIFMNTFWEQNKIYNNKTKKHTKRNRQINNQI